jgi:hypothetical protein
MTHQNGDESPNLDAHCSGGFCGPVDFGGIFGPLETPPEEKIELPDVGSEDHIFFLLLDQAQTAMNHWKVEEALGLYEQAYELASNSEAVGLDRCFGVIHKLHFFNFDQHAFRMCTEVSARALERKDTDLLRDIWKLLPELGMPGDWLNEAALLLRDGIETTHPEVMNYNCKSRRLF